MSDVTRLLDAAQRGDQRAAADLLPLVYHELRKLAAARMAAEAPDHTLSERAPPYRSCVAWMKDRWVAVGTSGSDVSMEDGMTWKPLDRENDNSVAFSCEGVGWAVGPKGRIAKYETRDRSLPPRHQPKE